MATLIDGCQPLTTNVQFTPILTIKMIVRPTFFIDGEYDAHFSITVRLFQRPFSFFGLFIVFFWPQLQPLAFSPLSAIVLEEPAK